MIALIFAVNPSVSLVADSLSLRLGHGAALICHWHITRRHFVTPYTGEAMGWSAAYPLHKGAYEDSANSADIASKRSICIVQNISIKSII